MSETNVSGPLRVLAEWEDEPESGRTVDDWPYPTRHIRSEAQGELAERIRRALNVTSDLPVYVEERIESGGWSEFTPEDDYFLTIEVGDTRRDIGEFCWSGGLTQLLRWLDTQAPVPDATVPTPTDRPTCDAVRYGFGESDYETEIPCTQSATVEVPLSDGRLHPRCDRHVPVMLRALARRL